MAMSEEGRMVLCGANAYDKKYYFNEKFNGIPESIKNDKVLKEEVEEALRKAIGEYKEQFQAR